MKIALIGRDCNMKEVFVCLINEEKHEVVDCTVQDVVSCLQQNKPDRVFYFLHPPYNSLPVEQLKKVIPSEHIVVLTTNPRLTDKVVDKIITLPMELDTLLEMIKKI